MPETTTHQLIENRMISPDDFHNSIPRIKEVSGVDLTIPEDLPERLAHQAQNLLIPPTLLAECSAALISGNIILQGPPGTGKSSLARALANAFNVELLPVTAHEDWSTFEVIGRQELRTNENGTEQIIPVNGHFTEAVIRCAGKIPKHQDDPTNEQATWLLIDELNRAHPDKAFGELFSVLGTDDPVKITLAYQNADNNELVVPRRFRIIGTINSIDKQFVNSLSQGLRRRFTFLTMDIPPKRSNGEKWGGTISDPSQANREFTIVQNNAVTRASRRTGKTEAELSVYIADSEITNMVKKVFDLVEKVRYAGEGDTEPYIPIGTAPLIDAVELFLIRAASNNLDKMRAGLYLDWAVSVKLVPLFDSGMVNRDKLATLARTLDEPLNDSTRRAILEIASDGLFYVE